MITKLCPPKDPEERVPLLFNFSADMLYGETIEDAEISVSLKQGVDGGKDGTLYVPRNLLTGRVQQWISGGLDDVSYLYRCKATTSLGRVLVLGLVVPVKAIA